MFCAIFSRVPRLCVSWYVTSDRVSKPSSLTTVLPVLIIPRFTKFIWQVKGSTPIHLSFQRVTAFVGGGLKGNLLPCKKFHNPTMRELLAHLHRKTTVKGKPVCVRNCLRTSCCSSVGEYEVASCIAVLLGCSAFLKTSLRQKNVCIETFDNFVFIKVAFYTLPLRPGSSYWIFLVVPFVEIYFSRNRYFGSSPNPLLQRTFKAKDCVTRKKNVCIAFLALIGLSLFYNACCFLGVFQEFLPNQECITFYVLLITLWTKRYDFYWDSTE